MHQLTPDKQRELARTLWEQEMSLPEIATTLRAATADVARMLVPESVVGDPASDNHRDRASHQRRLMAALAVELRDRGPARRRFIERFAERLGVSPATVRDYLWDPDGGKRQASRLEHRQRGTCPTCGDPTWLRSDDTSAYCARHLSDGKPTTMHWPQAVRLLHAFAEAYGRIPTTTDLDPARARRRGPEYEARLAAHPVPTPNQLRRLWRQRQAERNLPATGGARDALAEIFADHPLARERRR